jgi:hypothetical protein
MKKVPTQSWLDIILTIDTPSNEQIKEFKKQTLHKNLFLHFQDVHPNLIKGSIRMITVDSQKVTISFKGNVTDKEYLDYVTEVTNQLNAYQYHWKASTNDHNQEPETSSTNYSKERKVKFLKRKLTF